MTKKRNPAKPKHIIFILTLMLLVYLSLTRLLVIQGNSVNSTLAILIPPINLKKNDVVTFHYKHDFFNGERLRLAKRIKCLPGETLLKENESFFCEGVYLGEAKLKRKNGQDFPVFSYNGEIPPNKYFLFGDSLDSFDSRYFGLIDIDEIEYKGLEVF